MCGRIVSSLLVLLMAISVQAQAAVEMAEPIYIESDRLEIDEGRGISIYRGNVHFRQATSHVWADEVIVYTNAQQDVEKVEADGRPAKFHQYPAPPEVEELQGQARSIIYRAAEGLVVLEGDASLRQEKNQFSGNRIEYDSNKRVVKAGQKTPDGSGRVQVVIQPRNNTGAKPQAVQTDSETPAANEAQP